MLTPDQQDKIDYLLQQVEDLKEVSQAVLNFTSAEELFYFASQYNWDDGLEIPDIVANHPLCDLATALLLFWRAEAADSMENIQADSPPFEGQEDWFNFCKTITSRLLDGYYKPGPNSFAPELTRIQRYKYEKQGVSPLLLDGIDEI